MPQYIGFLRAINVGGHTVKMEKLKKLFEVLGFSKVETFIASGNVIFDSSSKNTQSLEKKIEAHLKKSLGYEVATFIRTPSETAAIAGYKPFPESELNADGHFLFIGFAARPPSAQVKKKLLDISSEVDEFHIKGREVYWLLRKRSMETIYTSARLEKMLEMPVTFRNANTVRKLAERYG